jgi:Flp pilus assembly protein TadB
MSQQGKIDLSHLPPQVRQQVEPMLAKLPPDMRKQVIGSPMLNKLVDRAEQEMRSANIPRRIEAAKSAAKQTARTSANIAQRMAPRGHYNSTIQPGDRVSLQGWAIGLAVIGAVIWVVVYL